MYLVESFKSLYQLIFSSGEEPLELILLILVVTADDHSKQFLIFFLQI